MQVIVESDSGATELLQEIAQLEPGELRPYQLGLTLREAKALLQNLQQTIVEQQTAQFLAQQSKCSDCGKKRLRKGVHLIVYRRLFGKLRLRSSRLFHCACQPLSTCTFSPLVELLSERTAPELFYLEAKFASLVSYGLSLKLFEEVLAIGAEINAATIWDHTLAVAERIESELGDQQIFFIEGCERDWGELPRPELPLAVGLDGGYVHSCEQKSKKDSCFEVIVGKSSTAEGDSKC